MTAVKKQYIFPELERKLFSGSGIAVLVVMELVLHSILIGCSIANGNLDGIFVSAGLAVLFGWVHFDNLLFRKYCLAQWSFDGTSFRVHIKEELRTVDVSSTFCLSTTLLAFNRRYSLQKYRFILIWHPGQFAPYEEMNGYVALKKREALIIPYNEESLRILRDELHIQKIPEWPKSGVYCRKMLK